MSSAVGAAPALYFWTKMSLVYKKKTLLCTLPGSAGGGMLMKVTVSLAVIHSGDMLLCVWGRGTGQMAVCEGRLENVPAVGHDLPLSDSRGQCGVTASLLPEWALRPFQLARPLLLHISLRSQRCGRTARQDPHRSLWHVSTCGSHTVTSTHVLFSWACPLSPQHLGHHLQVRSR